MSERTPDVSAETLYDPNSKHDPVYQVLYDTAEFVELRRRFRKFVFPATVAFLSWYLLYVVMSNWAEDFMNHKLWGNINVALVFGLLQFVSTFLIAWLYARHANKELDPLAAGLERRFNEETGRGVAK